MKAERQRLREFLPVEMYCMSMTWPILLAKREKL